MRRLAVLTLAFALVAPGIAPAQQDVVPDLDDPITLRMTSMKQVGAGMKALGQMAKGEIEFDAPLAQMSLRAMIAAASGYAGLFPEGSEQGHETTAAPAIWTDRDGFEASLAEFLADLHVAVQSPPVDRAALGPLMQTLGGDCKACHEDYRIKKN
ncbi:MAG TPA: cytochrome c [Paracoccaceae bacterium]|nr:cytochrome c [Paracoccaceae bacterium]